MAKYIEHLHEEHKARRVRLGDVPEQPPVFRPYQEHVRPPPPDPQPDEKPGINQVVSAILSLVSVNTGIPPTIMRSHRTHRDAVRARHVAMYVLRHHCEWPYPNIAFWFRQDPSSLIYAIERVEKEPDLLLMAQSIWSALSEPLKEQAKVEADMTMVDVHEANKALKIDWQAKALKLAASNERFRSALANIREMAGERSRIIMKDGTPLEAYCRSALLDGKVD